MMKIQSTLNEEDDLLTLETSDEALETAGGNEVVGSFTLGACTDLSVCPA